MTPAHDQRPRLLLVDDEPTNLQVLRHILQADYRLLFATDDERALQVAREQRPDLVLLDTMMPNLDGYSATSRLRKQGYDRPIIALTAHALKEEKMKCLAVGCNAYLSSPSTESTSSSKSESV